jgi:ADP-ribose pyrophosphatase
MRSSCDETFQNNVNLIEQNTVYQGFYRIEKIKLRHQLFNGNWMPPIEREVMVRGHAVAILLFDPQLSCLVFTEQFRIGAFRAHANPWVMEIAAGSVEPGESVETVAIRETKEETGLTIKQLLPIGEYWTSPANHSEKITLFCGHVDASQAGGTHGLAEEGEDIKVHVIPVQEAYVQLEQGCFKHAPALIALQWFKLHEHQVREQLAK